MKMVPPALALAVAPALLFIASFDSISRINRINKSGRNAAVIRETREDSILQSPFFFSNSDSVVFSLKSNKPYNLVKMSFGKGSWSMEEPADLANDLILWK